MKNVEYFKGINIKSNFEAVNLLQIPIYMKTKENYKLKKMQKNCIKMEKTIIKFGDIEIEKEDFHEHKRPILIQNINEI